MRRVLLWSAAFALAGWSAPAMAQLSDDMVKIGVATDMGGLYADINGPGAVIATQMAIEDFGGSVLGKKIEVISGDVQNKADVAATLAGRWYGDEKVDMILGASASSSSIAVMNVANEKKRIFLAPDPASSDITGKLCNPYTVQWVYDTASQANGTGSAVVKTGGKTWFFITADYAFGYALERDVSEVVKKAGGTVLGSVRAPISTNDFSSYLLQAQASKAQIIGLANAGGDTINAIKQAAEFGIVKGGQKLAGLVVFITDIHSLGLERAQGLRLTSGYYWDLNDKTRTFAKRFAEKHKGRMPTMVQAGFYSATLRYLQVVKETGTDKAETVMAKLKSEKWDDPLFGPSYIRVDGRAIHNMYLFEVKSPSESKGPWDYFKLLATIPGEQAFRPLNEGGCPLVKTN
ncbi:MAG: ABC transporter substrate-binding protein [Proteobacteria bacterium]|nr:ABC transporter substrate-binding protein [Pseudomonadota bacterium]